MSATCAVDPQFKSMYCIDLHEIIYEQELVSLWHKITLRKLLMTFTHYLKATR